MRDGGNGGPAAAEVATEVAAEMVDLLVAGLGPGGCTAALAAQAEGLSVLAVEARGREGNRGRLVVVRPKAQALLRERGMADITRGRRTTTLRQIEDRLRQALVDAQASGGPTGGVRPAVCWHTRVVALHAGPDRVEVRLRDEATGRERTVSARHVIDATGGRLEPLGRTARRRTGARHIVVTAEYETPPWFDGIAGVRDPETGDAFFLIPMRGRHGVTAYLDARPGDGDDEATLVRRFEAAVQRLSLARVRQEVQAVDVVQRLLPEPSRDRVIPIGDAAGTVDIWIGAGMSTAIEDGVEAAQGIAEAQRAGSTAAEMARTLDTSRRILSRHRGRMWLGRVVVAARPLGIRLWPTLALGAVHREALRSPRWLWQGIRVVFGRRPPAVPGGRD